MGKEKLLTVSVAGYNVEKYLAENLDSIVRSKYLDEIEVFVVDDGATDGSLAVARKYEAMYPGSIHAVHKENEGYGSTVSYSLAHATGRYFRLLDGDDWFDTDGLDTLIEHIGKCTSDWIVTRTVRMQEGAGKLDDPDPVWLKYTDQPQMNITDVPADFQVGMWETTFRTKLAKEHMGKIPNHTLYTDVLVVCYPLAYAETVSFLNTPLYCYRLGRDGQSVSRESRIKHYQEQIDVVDIVKKYYVQADVAHKAPLIRRRFTAYYKWQILVLMLLPASKENLNYIKKIESDAKQNYPDFYNDVKESRNIRLMRATGYLAYWPLVWHGIRNW